MKAFAVSFLLLASVLFIGCNRDVYVESVSIHPNTFNLAIGEETRISAVIYPPDATNKTVRWIVDTVAVIENGKIRGLYEGYSTIRCIAEDGFYSAGAKVFVGDIAGTFKGELIEQIDIIEEIDSKPVVVDTIYNILEEDVVLTIKRLLGYDNRINVAIPKSDAGLPFNLDCMVYIGTVPLREDTYSLKGETRVKIEGADIPIYIEGSYRLGKEFSLDNNKFNLSFLYQGTRRNIFFVGKKDNSGK